MNPLETFSSMVNPQPTPTPAPEPDGRYYPFLGREQVAYPGDPARYAMGPEHVFFRSIEAPPPPPADPSGTGDWSSPGSYWGTPGDDQSGDGSQGAGAQSNPGASQEPGFFSENMTQPEMDAVTNLTDNITSPFGNVVSAVAPFGSIVNLAARGMAHDINQTKTSRRANKDTIPWSTITPSGGSAPSNPGADPGSHGATGGLGPGGMGGRGGQHGADPTGGFGPGGMGGSSGPSGGASDPSTSGGSAGAGDSDGAPSGTWHKGGPVYDGNTDTYGPMNIRAHEGEYVLPPYMVEAFGIDTLDYLRRALAPRGQFQPGTGETQALPETLARHGVPR